MIVPGIRNYLNNAISNSFKYAIAPSPIIMQHIMVIEFKNI